MSLCWAWLWDTQAPRRSILDPISLSEALQTKHDCTFSGSHSCKVPSIPVGKWTEGGRGHFLPCRTRCLGEDGDISRECFTSWGWHFQHSEFIASLPLKLAGNGQPHPFALLGNIFKHESLWSGLRCMLWLYSSWGEEPAVSASCSVRCVNRQLDWTCPKALEECCTLPQTR